LYEYKGGRYIIINIGNMKIGQLWISCVIYKPTDLDEYFVREHDDFFEKFIPVITKTNPS
jgi:hypothetical protein